MHTEIPWLISSAVLALGSYYFWKKYKDKDFFFFMWLSVGAGFMHIVYHWLKLVIQPVGFLRIGINLFFIAFWIIFIFLVLRMLKLIFKK